MTFMNNQYRIMFVIRIPGDITNLICVGVDFDNSCLFSIVLYSLDHKIQLDFNTSHYPKKLMQLIKSEKELIDSGFYDIRTWEMTLFENSIKERKVFEMNEFKDRGLKKWAPFKSLPEQWTGVNNVFEDDKKVNKPQLDDYELNDINERIMDSLESETTLLFKIYEKGYFKNDKGIVAKIDPYQRIVKVRDMNGTIKDIPFNKIVGVEVI